MHVEYDVKTLEGRTVRCVGPIHEGRFRELEIEAEKENLLFWSKLIPPPKIGDRVRVTMNSLGEGVVESYFVENIWLGVCVRLDDPPAWHKRQQTNTSKFHGCALVFGTEME